jgi:hypothetical protein
MSIIIFVCFSTTYDVHDRVKLLCSAGLEVSTQRPSAVRRYKTGADLKVGATEQPPPLITTPSVG